MSESWPLHPTPKSYEFLSQWIPRIAKCYGLSYPVFCRKILHLNCDEIRNINIKPTDEALEILSIGTRQPIGRLRAMTIPKDWLLMDEAFEKNIAEDPDFIEKYMHRHQNGLSWDNIPWT